MGQAIIGHGEMNIFLTGGNGFIGKNIRQAFADKFTVLAPRRSELDLTDEIEVRDFFRKNNIDIVIHGAVKPGHRNAQDFAQQLYTNTRMFFNIIRNADRYDKMIFLGSGAVYDMRYYAPKMKEDYFDTHVPIDEHGFSKYIISKYIEQSSNTLELRLFGVFGKYEDYAIRFISNAICKTLFGLPITIKQNRFFDYLYIDDLMPVIEHFICHDGAQSAFNVTPDASIDLCTLAERIKFRSNANVPIIVKEQGLGPEYSGDNTRLRREFPGLSFTPIDRAIDQLYNWYETNLQLIDKDKLLIDK